MEQPTEVVETATQPEVVETVAQLSPEEVAEFNDYKKNKAHFQSVADKQSTELQKKILEEQIKREQVERELEVLRNPKPTELIKPIKPVKPVDYDPIDAVTRGTSSYQYEQNYREYLESIADYNEKLLERKEQALSQKFSAFEQFQEQRKQEEERQRFKMDFVTKLQAEGLDADSSIKAFEFFTSNDSLNPKTLVHIWKSITSSLEKQSFSAPATPTGSSVSAKPSPGEYTKNADKSWMYKTKK